MLPLLRFEEPIYPELQPMFVDAADKAIADLPSSEQLRAQWAEVNDKLSYRFYQLPVDEWFTRHANVSEEDFGKEPHRNRLNVVNGRIMHMSYHRGQLLLLTMKK
jgi:uncharacterized damage-inducible protein DinB